MSKRYLQHELAKFIPPASEQDYESLKADMAAKGQEEPIKLYQGKILDGWTRYRVCEELEMPPKFIEWKPEPGKSIIGAIVSWNIPRRHLTSAQKAALALEIEPELAKEARERQRAQGGAVPHIRAAAKKTTKQRNGKYPLSEKAAAFLGLSDSEEPELVNSKKDDKAGRAAEQAARIAGTNRQYVSDVKRIKQYSERLFQSIKNGELAITDAKKVMRRKQKARQLKQAAAAVTKAKGGGKASYKIEIADQVEGLKGIDKASVRLIITEPPFTEYGAPPRDKKRWSWTEQWMEECFRVLAPDGSLWIVCDPSIEHRFRAVADRIGMTTRLFPWYYVYGKQRGSDFPESYLAVVRCRMNNKHFVWNPNLFTLDTGKLMHDVWGIEKPIGILTDNAAERIPDFPQQLPLDLVRPIVEAHSEPGDLVVELFAGAATAGVACLELGGRRYVGIESAPRQANLALERLKSIKAARAPKEIGEARR